MSPKKPGGRPGDLFLDRYMPGATPQQREDAARSLRAFAAVMLRVFTRLAQEDEERAIRARGE